MNTEYRQYWHNFGYIKRRKLELPKFELQLKFKNFLKPSYGQVK